ncbi:uncharacterized protein [Arachis hypogaea]|uniref:uncharacterized protein isoform X5 n=1 Tax=Arachis hypogaea TaxID=3818 RepID=UPI003B21FF44
MQLKMNHIKASQSTLADRVLWIRNQHHIVRNFSFASPAVRNHFITRLLYVGDLDSVVNERHRHYLFIQVRLGVSVQPGTRNHDDDERKLDERKRRGWR